MRGPLVVVGPGLGGAERERAGGNGRFAARSDIWRPLLGQARERQRLRHRLGVLELMLGDHPDDEAPFKQRIPTVERQLGKQPQNGLAHLPYIGARGVRRQDRQAPSLIARMGEGIVEVVELRRHCRPSADAPQEPKLLEVADVSEIPDER